MLDATIVTFACNREEHLNQSIQSWLRTPYPIVVVDYSSGKQIQINNDQVKVVRVEDRQKKWNRAHAANVGANHVETPLMFILDADLPVEDFEQFNDIARQEYFAVQHAPIGRIFKDFEGGGSCLLWMEDFRRTNGLPEFCEGWGYEDRDFFLRLYRQKIRRRPFQADYLDHDETDRYVNSDFSNRWHSHCVNSYRSHAYAHHVDKLVGNYGKPIGGSQPVGYQRPSECLPVYDIEGNEISIVEFLNENFPNLNLRGNHDFRCICEIGKYHKDILRVISILKCKGTISIGTVTGG